MSRRKEVLLLGAYGLAGEAILMALADRGISVVAAGRNERKLQSAIRRIKTECPEANIRPAASDLQDADALARELSSAGIVINAVGPYLDHGQTVALKAVETTTHYIDIASEQEHYRRLKGLCATAASAGVFLGVGFGLYPGVSGILTGHLLDCLGSPAGASIYLAMDRNPASGGQAQLATGILELTTRLEERSEGGLRRYKPSRTAIVDFGPPFGVRQATVWPQLEVLSMSGLYELVECKSGIYSPELGRPTRFHEALTRVLSPQKYEWSRRFLLRMVERMGDTAGDGSVPPGAAVSVQVWGGGQQRTARLYASDTERATAVLPAVAAQRLADRGGRDAVLKGVVSALEYFSKEDVDHALRGVGVEVKVTE